METVVIESRTHQSTKLHPAFVFVRRDMTVLEALLRYRKAEQGPLHLGVQVAAT